MAFDVVGSRSSSICWRHTERYTERLSRHTGKLWELVTGSLLSLITGKTPKHGRYLECDESISAAHILVEYEKDDGTTGILAECSVCDDVVRPE